MKKMFCLFLLMLVIAGFLSTSCVEMDPGNLIQVKWDDGTVTQTRWNETPSYQQGGGYAQKNNNSNGGYSGTSEVEKFGVPRNFHGCDMNMALRDVKNIIKGQKMCSKTIIRRNFPSTYQEPPSYVGVEILSIKYGGSHKRITFDVKYKITYECGGGQQSEVHEKRTNMYPKGGSACEVVDL